MNHPAAHDLTIPGRFCGPPNSGNGGWSAGALARHIAGDDTRGSRSAVEVTLRQPPPLDAPMAVYPDDDGTLTASFGGATVLQARPVPDAELVPVDPVPAEVARAAEASYPGLTTHPFATCFVCGTGREPGDGLRIFPGPVEPADGRARVAATWTPDPSLQDTTHSGETEQAGLEATWAALDCTGAWAADIGERMMVLGRMTAAVDTLPVIGEEHVVVGLHHRTEGRKSFTATTLHDTDGRVVARAEHVWIAIDPSHLA